METTLKIFEVVNYVVISIASGALLFPMLYTILLLIPQKKYPEAKKNHRFTVVVCARNERNVVPKLIESIRAQDYPRELIDVLVVAHNCTDDTAEVARAAGAEHVLEVNDPDRKHARKSYALHAAFDMVLNELPDTEAVVVMDADNLMDERFILEMNKAFDRGAEIGSGFRNSKNPSDNCIAGSNALTLLRDCRINGHARTVIPSTVPLGGTGFYVSRKVIEDMGGWNCYNIVEDLEFTVMALAKRHRARYVSKAMFYDEQPHDLKNSLIRQTRIGKGVFTLFFKRGLLMLGMVVSSIGEFIAGIGRFMGTGKFGRLRNPFGFIDMLLYFLYGPVAVIACFWFPFYYIFQPSVMLAYGQYAEAAAFGIMVAKMVGLYVLLPITAQNIIVLLLEHKRVKMKPIRIVTTLLIFPWYNLLCAVAITIGVLNPKLWWAPTKHDRPLSLAELKNSSRRKNGSEA